MSALNKRILELEARAHRGHYGFGAEQNAAWESAIEEFEREKLNAPEAWAEIEAQRQKKDKIDRQYAKRKMEQRERKNAREKAETDRQYAKLERLAIEKAGGLAAWGELTEHERIAFREYINSSLEHPLFISHCTS